MRSLIFLRENDYLPTEKCEALGRTICDLGIDRFDTVVEEGKRMFAEMPIPTDREIVDEVREYLKTAPKVPIREQGDIAITILQPGFIEPMVHEECTQGWQSTPQKLTERYKDMREGRSITLVAYFRNEPSGYCSFYYSAVGGPYRDKGIPEIVNLNVLEKYRGRGIGSLLLDISEEYAALFGEEVCLSVGLHCGYGSAQRLFVKRGYIPDESGVWYADCPVEPYAPVTNDDDLALHLKKQWAKQI